MRWAVRTEAAQDLGTVHVNFVGTEIDSFRFETAWPKARFRHDGRHFMDKRFRLEVVNNTQRVKVFKTVRQRQPSARETLLALVL